MYFPHLFARRAELLALRDASAEHHISATISPVLEPLKFDSTDLIRCLGILGEANVSTSVIVNPTKGDFANEDVEEWRATLAEVFEDYPAVLPAFVCRAGTTEEEVNEFLAAYPGREVSLLYWSPSLTNAQIQGFVQVARIRYHINLHDQMSASKRALLPLNKAVDVNDHFNHLPRNADYEGQEFFSDDHINFSEDSYGFGDYSIVGARFIPGGGPAHAVAIHGIFVHEDGTVWVEHFVSDDTEADVGTVEGKYLQAAEKFLDAVDARPQEFGDDAAITGFRHDVDEENFPGLAMNKRRQIHHHIARMHQLLGGE